MARRFKETEKKLNWKKVFAVILIPIFLVLIVFWFVNALSHQDAKLIKRTKIEGFFAAKQADGKINVINSDGQTVLETPSDNWIVVPNKQVPLFIVQNLKDKEKGLFDTTIYNENGNTILKDYKNVIPIEYDSVNKTYDQKLLKFEKDGKWGIISYEGTTKYGPEFTSISFMGNIDDKLKVVKDGKQGVIDSQSTTYAIPPIYVSVEPISNMNDTLYDVVFEKLHGVMDQNGKKILPTEFTSIAKCESKDHVVATKGGQTQIYDLSGNVVLNASKIPGEIVKIQDGTIIAKKGEQYGAFDLTGKEKLPIAYTKISIVNPNVFVTAQDGKYNITKVIENTEKNEVQKMLPEDVEYIKYNADAKIYIATVTKDGKSEDRLYDDQFQEKKQGQLIDISKDGYILINENGNDNFYNFKFDPISEKEAFKTNNLFRFKENGKYGFKDAKDKVVVAPIYSDAEFQNTYGFIAVARDGKWGALDYNGKVVCPCQYDLKDYLVIDFIGEYHRLKDVQLLGYETSVQNTPKEDKK